MKTTTRHSATAHLRRRVRSAAALAAAAVVWACGDDPAAPLSIPPPPRPASVLVIPASAGLDALGAMVQLSAEVLDQDGRVMEGAQVEWRSTDPAVASVDGTGLVTAVSNGKATVAARAGGASGTAAIAVAQEAASVAVVPEALEMSALGDTARLTAQVLDRLGNAVDD